MSDLNNGIILCTLKNSTNFSNWNETFRSFCTFDSWNIVWLWVKQIFILLFESSGGISGGGGSLALLLKHKNCPVDNQNLGQRFLRRDQEQGVRESPTLSLRSNLHFWFSTLTSKLNKLIDFFQVRKYISPGSIWKFQTSGSPCEDRQQFCNLYFT